MSEYTPTTREVLDTVTFYDGMGGPIDEDAFCRWLAEHDRQVAEAAWDEGFESGELSESGSRAELEYEYGDYSSYNNPHRKGEA